jgi:hypothetical protein
MNDHLQNLGMHRIHTIPRLEQSIVSNCHDNVVLNS